MNAIFQPGDAIEGDADVVAEPAAAGGRQLHQEGARAWGRRTEQPDQGNDGELWSWNVAWQSIAADCLVWSGIIKFQYNASNSYKWQVQYQTNYFTVFPR